MRIALDFDGTIADAAGAKVAHARERWGIDLSVATSMRPEAVPLMGEARYDAMIRDVFGTAISLEMLPVPGAVEALARLGRAHDLYVVTARLDHERPFAEQWLKKHGIEVRSMAVTNRGPKVDHCLGFGAQVLLEDSAAELTSFNGLDHAIAMALLETDYNAGHERMDGWHLVPGWTAFEALVEALSRA